MRCRMWPCAIGKMRQRRRAIPCPRSTGSATGSSSEYNHGVSPLREQPMFAHRVTLALSLVCAAGAAAAAAAPAAEPAQPFSIQDMVRMERISDVAVAPDGKHVAYTQRTTDMEANKGRTSVWLLDTGKRGAMPLRLTDGGPNSNSPEWSEDGKFIYFLCNRSGTNQVWRVSSNGTGPRGDTPVADSTQVTNLPLDVGSFRVSPNADRILV